MVVVWFILWFIQMRIMVGGVVGEEWEKILRFLIKFNDYFYWFIKIDFDEFWFMDELDGVWNG